VPRLAKDDRVLAGVAGGVARELGVDPVVVRVGFVVLVAAGGLGIALYAGLWLVMYQHAERHPDDAYAPQPKGASEGGRIAGVACIVVGLVLASQSLGLGLGIADSLVWPVALVGAGLVVALRRSERGPQAWAGDAARAVTTDRLGLARVLGGLVLVGGGIVTLLATRVDPGELWTVALAVFVTVAGVGLVVAPWAWRIVGELTEERRRRIRSDERAAMAAHLHDSVLQTLALIQRHANDPALAAQLARRQERELRTWLYESERRPERSYRTAFEELALDVEELHRVPVEVVVVGDAQVGERDEALVAAAREAVVNAAQHAGADRVDVYVELGDELREAFVRDTGAGFDRTQVPPGRRGIADSIIGRMERAGGTAEIDSTPGAGTEVHLRLPVEVRP
jgi:signal transduction histidine kinase